MLPSEIFDIILSYLSSDFVSLKSCAQALPFLRKLVERYLYAKIVFHADVDQHSGDLESFTIDPHQFGKLLQFDRSLANHVRSLCIVIPVTCFFKPELRWSISNISRVLPLLPELTSISLKSGYNPIMWDRLREDFRVAFTHCIQLPSVTQVCLHGIFNFPLSVLDKCKNVKRLSLDGRLCDSGYPSTLPCLPLESLQINHHASQSLTRIISWAKFNRIRSLNFRSVDPISFHVLSQLLEVCSDTLVDLELDLQEHFHITYDLVNGTSNPPTITMECTLPVLTCLEKLTIRASMTSTYGYPYFREVRTCSSSLPAIRELLLNPSSLLSTRHLILQLHFTFANFFSLSEVDWSPLTILSSHQAYHPSCPVDLRISAKRNKITISSAEIRLALMDNSTLRRLVEENVVVLS